jgi:hypothetical protein
MERCSTALLLVLLLVGCRFEDVRSPSRQVHVAKGYVTFEGRWRALAQAGSVSIPKVNTTSGACYRATMTCTESISKLFTKDEWAIGGTSLLSVMTMEYQVVE